MREEEAQPETRLREALHRYAERFEPAHPEGEVQHARRADLGGPGGRRWRYVWVPVVAAMAVIVTLVVLPRRNEPQITFVEPAGAVAPQYRTVRPTPVFPAGTTMDAIQARGVLRVGIKFDQPGFGLKDGSGKLRGFDAEIARLIGAGLFGGSPDELGRRIEFIETKSSDRQNALQAGTVDIVVATYTITEGRRQEVDFAGPYFRARQDIMVRTDDTAIRGVTDLGGKSVCTVSATTSHANLATHAPGAKVWLMNSYSECAQALLDRHVDAVTTDEPILAGYVQQSRNAFKLVNNPFSDEPYGVGLKKGDEAFRAFLNHRLEEISNNGDWSRAAAYTLSDIQTLRPPALQRP